MQAIYFMSGVLITSGILMQFNGGNGTWGSAIMVGIVLTIGATIAEYMRK